MKMPITTTPGAIYPSPNAFYEVDVSEEAYVLKDEGVKNWSWGDDPRNFIFHIITGPESHVHASPGWVSVTPEGDGNNWTSGVRMCDLKPAASMPSQQA